MTWSSEKPTQPGWYWGRNVRRRGEIFMTGPEVHEVYGCMDPYIYTMDMQLYVDFGTRELHLSDLTGEWAGPLPEPAEPA